jgi:hypothetical protein
MNQEIRMTGGAKVGWVSASWPLGQLSATTDRITLNATLIGKYDFSHHEVVSLEEYGFIPLIGRGIQIVHNKKEYPKKIVFWCFGNPESKIEEIKRVGFTPSGTMSAEISQRGFPIRWQAILVLVVFWNLLLFKDMSRDGGLDGEPGLLSLVAVLTFFLISVLIWKSEIIENTIMAAGHKPSEIKSFLYLIALVTGIMSFVMGIMLFTENV